MHFAWEPPGDVNGKAVTGYWVKTNADRTNAEWFPAGAQRVKDVDTQGPNRQATLYVWAANNDPGQPESVGNYDEEQGQSGPAPPPAHNINVYSTGRYETCDISSTPGAQCVIVHADLSNYPPNSYVELKCWSNQYNTGWAPHTVRVNGAGSYSEEYCHVSSSAHAFWIESTNPYKKSNTIDP